MTSAIDATKPVTGNPTTQSVRDQFATAKSEITALQSAVAGAGTLTGVTAGTGITVGGAPPSPTVALTVPVTVANGGTEATTPGAALIALGAVAKAGDTMTGLLTLSDAPTTNLHAATKLYVDGAVSPLAPLANPVFTGDPRAPTPATVDSDTSIATTAYVQANFAAKLPVPLTVALGGTGGTTAAAARTALGAVNIAGDTITGQLQVNNVIYSAGSVASIAFDDRTTTGAANRWAWYSLAAKARLTCVAGIGTDLVTVDSVTGNVGIGAAAAATPYKLAVSTAIHLVNSDYVAGSTGQSLLLDFGTGYPRLSALATGQNSWTNLLLQTGGGNVGIGTTGPTTPLYVVGTCTNTSGSWVAISDERVKSDVAPYERGLDAILALEPVSFRYNEHSPFAAGDIGDGPPRDAAREAVLAQTRYGLIADQVRPHVPEAVGSTQYKPDPEKDEAIELSTLDPTHLVYVLVNATKELAARNSALEARLAALEGVTNAK